MSKYLTSLAAEWISESPKLYECEHLVAAEPGVKPLFFSGWKNTRVFAWIGLPKGASKEHPVPGIVLVHGGGGTAFSHWVKWWNDRGYAAIAADNCGAMPTQPISSYWRPESGWPRHAYSGAPGWGAFDQGDLPPDEQWFAHAVSSVILAHNVLRATPGVDIEHIGITGVSWGSVLSCIVCGLDSRFKAHIPVYGCGFLAEAGGFVKSGDFKKLSPAALEWWKNEYDPVNFLKNVTTPTLWFATTNDGAFPIRQWQKSTELVSGISERSLRLRWLHGHGRVGEQLPDFEGFFAEHLKNGPKRMKISKPRQDGGVFSVEYTDAEPDYAVLLVCEDTTATWMDWDYHPYPAKIDRNRSVISAKLPDNWLIAFLSVRMTDNQYVTSKVIFF